MRGAESLEGRLLFAIPKKGEPLPYVLWQMAQFCFNQEDFMKSAYHFYQVRLILVQLKDGNLTSRYEKVPIFSSKGTIDWTSVYL
jgi:hypothetical protein